MKYYFKYLAFFLFDSFSKMFLSSFIQKILSCKVEAFYFKKKIKTYETTIWKANIF